jgi:hypothetical protein
VLDQNVVLQDGDLGEAFPLPNDHLAHHGFTPGEELRLAQHWRTPPTCLPALPPTLALGLHAGRTVNPGDFGGAALAWLADPDNGIHRVVGG